MKKYSLEFSVGVFVLIGLLCLAYMTVKLGKMEVFSGQGHSFTARFQSIAGLKVGASVEVAGVPVGKVTRITLDPNIFYALVTMQVNDTIPVTDDTIASIKTSGIIGDKYINLSMGGGSPLEPNAILTETESALDLESLVSKYVFGDVK